MSQDELFERVSQIIAETLNVKRDVITRDTMAEDVDGWDSLTHTILMVRLQRRLNLTVGEKIAATATNVGELCDMIAAVNHIG